MKTKTVRIGFYEAKLADTRTRTLDQILKEIENIPLGTPRTTEFREQTLHLKELSYRTEGFWIGDVSRIRLDERIVLSDAAGEEEVLPCDDRGLAHRTAFLYYPPARTFVATESGSGPSNSAVAGCLKQLAQAQNIELQLMLNEGALARLFAMKIFTRLKIKISNMGQTPTGSGTLNNLFGMLSDFQSSSALIDLRANKEVGSLTRITQLVSELMSSPEESVTQLLVVGSEGDADEKSTVDLFKDRMMETVRINLGDGERVSDVNRYDCLRKAFERRRSELDRRIRR